MNQKRLRREAASLARECRSIDRRGRWTIKEWNDSVRSTIRIYMRNAEAFARYTQTWEEA